MKIVIARAVLAMVLIAVLPSCATPLDHPLQVAAEGVAVTDQGGWRVKLFWTTETESEAFGFYVHRADSEAGPARIVNSLEPLHAAGTTSTPQEYTFYDLDVDADTTYFYKLEQVDLDGTRRFIVGHPTPVPANAKPISEDENEEIKAHGTMYREERG